MESSFRLEALDIRLESTVLRSEHVAGKITDETANHDLTIQGATRESFLRRLLVGSVAEGVVRTAVSSVILARRAPTQNDPRSGLTRDRWIDCCLENLWLLCRSVPTDDEDGSNRFSCDTFGLIAE